MCFEIVSSLSTEQEESVNVNQGRRGDKFRDRLLITFSFSTADMDIIMPCSKRISTDLTNTNGPEGHSCPAVQFSKSEIQNFLTVSDLELN